mmetsp:Transcript_27004/g.55327  ORF Transcript_27004/g.55327 Transcript_27004/m.55327 type:complete len:341 (+) Transcript_27004:47-1069(+)
MQRSISIKKRAAKNGDLPRNTTTGTPSLMSAIVFCSIVSTFVNVILLIKVLLHTSSYPKLKTEEIIPDDRTNITRPPCIIFLHIPKVGGRTVNTFLKTLANAMGFRFQGIYSEKYTNATELSLTNTLTSGHFSTKLFEYNNVSKKCFKMTVLRDPIDRAISAFFYHDHKYPDDVDECLYNTHISNKTGHRLPKRNTCKYKSQYSNDMTRRLSGMNGTKWNSYLEDKYFSSSEPNIFDLREAKDNLENKFDAVCFLHYLASCVGKVRKPLFNFQQSIMSSADASSTIMTTNSKNRFRTKSRPKILDSDTMDRFRYLNSLDVELYHWSMEKFLYRDIHVMRQ